MPWSSTGSEKMFRHILLYFCIFYISEAGFREVKYEFDKIWPQGIFRLYKIMCEIALYSEHEIKAFNSILLICVNIFLVIQHVEVK